jgi:hypothetical protein
MKKRASIYYRQSKLFIQADSRTQSGIWVGDGPVDVLEEHSEAVADAVQTALQYSRHGVPTPRPSEDLTVETRKLAGVKSWRTFVKNATLLCAALDGEQLTLTPYRRVDRAGNYVPQPERALKLSAHDAGLGKVILELLRHSTG